MRKKLWLTYAWEDNIDGDVEFLAQELTNAGIEVRLDRWEIQAGKRLWEQISEFITDETQSDAWAIFATPNSLQSEPCKEEIAYALERALENRGAIFPFIGIVQATVDKGLLPYSIKTRLYVSIKDNDWVERTVSAVEGKAPNIPRMTLDPYTIDLYKHGDSNKIVVELRPRAGSWAHFFCAIPIAEKLRVNPTCRLGPRGQIPALGGVVIGRFEKPCDDHVYWVVGYNAEATPTMSCFFYCSELPSELRFGAINGEEYSVTITDIRPKLR